MRPVVLYIATSLDGYIARPDGGVDWLSDIAVGAAQDQLMSRYAGFYETVDTLIMGRRTYDQVLTFGKWPYMGRTCYVLTARHATPDPNVMFTSSRPAALCAEIQNQPGRTIWLVGGRHVVRDFQRSDLIDEYRITVIPILLGDGIRLFSSPAAQQQLRLRSTHTIADTVELHYTRR